MKSPPASGTSKAITRSPTSRALTRNTRPPSRSSRETGALGCLVERSATAPFPLHVNHPGSPQSSTSFYSCLLSSNLRIMTAGIFLRGQLCLRAGVRGCERLVQSSRFTQNSPCHSAPVGELGACGHYRRRSVVFLLGLAEDQESPRPLCHARASR